MTSNKTPDHHHTAEEERKIREAALDRTVEESFPASDPPSTNPNPDNHDALKKDVPDVFARREIKQERKPT